jgi:hypothetical protein
MATWATIAGMGRSTESLQATTEAGPPGDSDGCNLNDVGGFDLVVEATSGTFGGAGTLSAYRQHDATVGWSYSPGSTIDLATLTPSVVGSSRFSVEGWTVANPRGFIAHLANGITGVGGVRVRYYCTGLKGERV